MFRQERIGVVLSVKGYIAVLSVYGDDLGGRRLSAADVGVEPREGYLSRAVS